MTMMNRPCGKSHLGVTRIPNREDQMPLPWTLHLSIPTMYMGYQSMQTILVCLTQHQVILIGN